MFKIPMQLMRSGHMMHAVAAMMVLPFLFASQQNNGYRAPNRLSQKKRRQRARQRGQLTK